MGWVCVRGIAWLEALGDLLAASGRVWEAFGEALEGLLGGSGRPFGRLWVASGRPWEVQGGSGRLLGGHWEALGG